MQTHEIILDQLGGGRFVTMTGAKNLVSMPDGIMFSIGKGAKDGINKVSIKLTLADLYDIEFYSIRGVKAALKATARNIYAEGLQRTFTHYTGFDTHL